MSTYEGDLAAWSDETAQRLRLRAFDEIDIDALIEEISEVGRSQRRAIRSYLEVLLFHLLKLGHAGENDIRRAGPGWRRSVRQARREIQGIIEDSPSLSPYPLEVLAKAYNDAQIGAVDTLDLSPQDIPAECPWTIAEMLTDEFYGR